MIKSLTRWLAKKQLARRRSANCWAVIKVTQRFMKDHRAEAKTEWRLTDWSYSISWVLPGYVLSYCRQPRGDLIELKDALTSDIVAAWVDQSDQFSFLGLNDIMVEVSVDLVAHAIDDYKTKLVTDKRYNRALELA